MRIMEVKPTSVKYPYKIFCDLDGVLADFDKRMSELLGEPYSASAFESDKKYKNRMWDTVKRYSAEGGEFWNELDLLPNAHRLWDRIKNLDTEILSATGSSIMNVDKQKYEWVARMLSPNIKVNLVQTARQKRQYAAPNHILIDDKMRAIGPWREDGGIGIHHADENIDDTLRFLDGLGL